MISDFLSRESTFRIRLPALLFILKLDRNGDIIAYVTIGCFYVEDDDDFQCVYLDLVFQRTLMIEHFKKTGVLRSLLKRPT